MDRPDELLGKSSANTKDVWVPRKVVLGLLRLGILPYLVTEDADFMGVLVYVSPGLRVLVYVDFMGVLVYVPTLVYENVWGEARLEYRGYRIATGLIIICTAPRNLAWPRTNMNS